MKKNKNILVNAYTHLNLGDDLFLKILFERYPNVNFTLIANKDDYKNAFKTDNVSYLSYPKSILNQKFVSKVLNKLCKFQFLKKQYQSNRKFLKKNEHLFDATITIGGSIFMEKSDERMNEISTHHLLYEVFPHKPKFILGANFGPYKNSSFLKFYENLFHNYADVCFRDSYSKSLFKLQENIRNHSDIVFSGEFQRDETIKGSVGFSLIDVSKRNDLSRFTVEYQDLVVELLNLYIDKGYTPYLFSFCKYEGDEKAINQILELINKNNLSNIKTIFYNGDIENFINIYSQMEIMFPTRFHAMILSMIFEQKMHPIVYSKKMTDILTDMEYIGNFADIKNIDNSVSVSTAFSNEKFLLDPSIKSDASLQFSELDKFIAS